jgi:hypothetical protein
VTAARKFKTCQTSLSLFDQAITAPSMKAALEVAPHLGPYAFPVKFHRLNRRFQTFATKLADTSAGRSSRLP